MGTGRRQKKKPITLEDGLTLTMITEDIKWKERSTAVMEMGNRQIDILKSAKSDLIGKRLSKCQ